MTSVSKCAGAAKDREMTSEFMKTFIELDHPWTYLEADGSVRYDPKHRPKLISISALAPSDATHWKFTWGEPRSYGARVVSRATVEYTGDAFTLSFGGGWMPLFQG